MNKIKKACIIEDNDIQIFILKKSLQNTGRVEEVVIFKNGKMAYDQLSAMHEKGEEFPELILLDIFMPVWDAWDFLNASEDLFKNYKGKLVLLTSSLSVEDEDRAENYSLRDSYYLKPIQPRQLNALLDEITTNKS